MRIYFKTLTLQCRKSREVIDLDSQISFFHGKVSSGKSSIARLIDFCLGGGLERTPAILQELVSVTLELYINNNLVLIEREATENNQCVFTWIDAEEKTATVLAPIKSGEKVIWGENIHTLSDLIFHLLEIEPLIIPSNQDIERAKLGRLSFRNFMWYCYLDQHRLDSSFYRLDDPVRARNSREAMKFIMTYSSLELVRLEEELVKSRETRQTKLSTIKELRGFLTKFGYADIGDIEVEIEKTQKKLKESEAEKDKQQQGYIKETHTSDDTRLYIKKINEEIERTDGSFIDLKNRLAEQEALKSELIATKFKLARSSSVANILSGVKFDSCPQCGSQVKKVAELDHACGLCGTETEDKVVNNENAEIVRLDIDSRIKDIDNSIENHKDSLKRQEKLIVKMVNHKTNLEIKLAEELKSYESIFLANTREVDRRVATYKERLKGQSALREMPKEIAKLEDDAVKLEVLESKLKRQIEHERTKLIQAESYVSELEATFLDTLLTVGLPGVSENDEVHINRKTWEVFVFPDGEEYKKWNFSNAGSGGKKTLFNVCYLLSIHAVAAKNNLRVPSFMIVDTPMKNIDKEVNEDLFKRFYDHLYNLAAGVLNKTQIILIDNSFISPKLELKLPFFERYMTDSDENNPPLITYYRGA